MVGNKKSGHEIKIHHWRLDIGEYPARIGTVPLYIKFRESDILAWAGNLYLFSNENHRCLIVKDGEKTEKDD